MVRVHPAVPLVFRTPIVTNFRVSSIAPHVSRPAFRPYFSLVRATPLHRKNLYEVCCKLRGSIDEAISNV